MFSRLMLVALFLVVLPAAASDNAVTPVVVGHVHKYTLPAEAGSARQRDGAWHRTHLALAPGAGFVKLRLVDVQLRPGDTLTVSAAGGRVIETLSARGPNELGTFWTLSVPGSGAFLDLRSAQPHERWPFSIDALVAGDPRFSLPLASRSRSVCGAPDFEDAVCYAADTGRWAASRATAGVMVVDADAATALFCTAVNVAPEGRMLTNNHCIAHQAQCDNAEFVFDFHRSVCNDDTAAPAGWVGYRCDGLLASQPLVDCEAAPGSLDFTLTGVIGNPTDIYGYVQPDSAALSGSEPVYIVQHPDGRPKEITHGAELVVGAHTLAYAGTLDTEPGSSGAPIFRQSDNALVGLHHCGGCDGAAQYNRGMPMTALVPELQPWLCSASLAVIAYEPDSVGESGNGGDAIADPGEQWSVLPRVLNRSCGLDATQVVANYAINPASTALVTLLDSQASFGTVVAGTSRSASAPVRLSIDPLTTCGSRIVIDTVTIQTANGGHFVDAGTLLDLNVGSERYATLIEEQFAGGIAPGWTVGDFGSGSGPAASWTDANPGARTLYLSAPFLIADSAALGPGALMDEELITPPLDTSSYESLTLRFRHDFSWFSGGGDEQADVELRSSATGSAWQSLVNFSGRSANGLVEIDVGPWSGSELQLRFRYHNARFDYWWAIDDIELIASTGFDCTPELDYDADGIVDAVDNCVDHGNPAQRDSDGDGIGNACDPDIAPSVNDCSVDFADLAALRDALFSRPGDTAWNADADFDGDGNVNFADLAILRSFLFGTPGPSALTVHCGV